MKKYTKKLISILCIVLFVLGGCSSKTYGLDPKKPIAISLWHYYNSTQKQAFDSLITEFNETLGKEKGIVINATSLGSINDLSDAVISSAKKKAGAEDLPDMFATYADTAMQIDENDILANLDTYLSTEEKSNYMDAYIEEGTINGEFKLFPIAKATETFMLNKSDWDEFAQATGVTYESVSTWEGVVDVAAQYYDYSGGAAFFGRDAFANYMLVGSVQLGHPLLEEKDGTITLQVDKETMRTLWDNYYVPYVKGYFYTQGRFASDDLKTHDIIALTGSTSGAAFFPTEVSIQDDTSYPIEHAVLPLPNFSGSEAYSVQQGAGIAVTATNETHEYASVQFLKWFTEKERNLAFSAQSAYLPVLKDANDPEILTSTLEKANIQISDTVKDVLLATLKQNQSYTLYTSPTFDNGFKARSYIETSMKELAKQDKASIDNLVQTGSDRESALAPYLNDDTFEAWFQDFQKQLQNIVKP